MTDREILAAWDILTLRFRNNATDPHWWELADKLKECGLENPISTSRGH